MKCVSCETEINPKWTFAISENVCPMCGQSIMDEKLKDLFSTLRETMISLQEYPEQLNDWLLSNHNFIKTDSPNLVDFVPKEMFKTLKRSPEKETRDGQKYITKVKTENGEEDVMTEKIQSDDETSDFFKRAMDIKKDSNSYQSPSDKTQHLKKMAQQIKRAGTTSFDGNGNNLMISAKMLENADSDAVAEYQQMISGGELISDSFDDEYGDSDIPSAVLNMANRARGNGGSSNAADLMKLQQMQNRVKNSQNAFNNGDSRGKGGFSRA